MHFSAWGCFTLAVRPSLRVNTDPSAGGNVIAMTDTDRTHDGEDRFDAFEERIEALEAKNERLESRLEREQRGAVTRRQIIAGVVGGGALLGTTTQSAAAASGQWEDTNGDNLLELPNHGGIDVGAVEADGLAVNAKTVQSALDGHVVPVASGLGVSDAIDPASTSTPVQDAIDKFSYRVGGTVLLPPTTVDEGAPINMFSGCRIVGWGGGDIVTTPTSQIRFPSGGHDLVRFDDDFVHRGCALVGFTLDGQAREQNQSTGVGIRCGDPNRSASENQNVTRSIVNDVTVRGLTAAAIKNEAGSAWVDCEFGRLAIGQVDNGTDPAIDFIDGFGFGNHIAILSAYLGSFDSGEDGKVIHAKQKGSLSIGHANIGGATGAAIVWAVDDGWLNVGGMNYEASDQQSTGGPALRKYGIAPWAMGDFIIRASERNRTMLVGSTPSGAGNLRMGTIFEGGGGTLTLDKPVNVIDDTTHPVVYAGPSNHVDNTSGSALSVPVSCLADLTTVS